MTQPRRFGGNAYETAPAARGAGTRRAVTVALALLLVLLLVACDDNQVLDPDPSVQDLVGQWDAVELVFTPQEGGGSPVDVLATGAEFFLDVQPSGLYTAYLTLQGSTFTEIGMLEVGATRIVMEAHYPQPGTSTGTYTLEDGTLTVEGQTETALGVPGTTSVVDVLMVFQRR